MADIYLTNSLTRKKEVFVPLNPSKVGMYTCGPTVYDYATIGNFRTYSTADLLVRVLKFNGYQVNYVMNLTDVGHLTGDNTGDADTGVDRMEKASKKEGKNPWEIADFYISAFMKDFEKMNLTRPFIFARATEHIPEQIKLVQELEKKGLAYKTGDGIYFDTLKFEEQTGKKYGELSNMDAIKEGARVEVNPEKKSPRDFALWRFSPGDEKRQMEWDSPWGIGFPGWHIECSAMGMKYLGETFDIHAGGEDLRQTHHPNEIAQSEGATGKLFVKYWIHATFLQVDGRKMGKSLGNAYTITDIEDKGFDPLSLRYLYLSSYYRDTLNFTWESLKGAENALKGLRDMVSLNNEQTSRTILSPEKDVKIETFRNDFLQAVNDDLNTPRALVVLREMLKSNIPSKDKFDLALSFDEVLGLNLNKVEDKEESVTITGEMKDLLNEREKLRKQGKFTEADEIRKKLEEKGYKIADSPEGPSLKNI
ncbi:cysteine--tRNA ligase [Candidatus Woesebacteria bacterium]|nr:cysteine--tRNA ligase [Candidatus Woesebacteria bacterium]